MEGKGSPWLQTLEPKSSTPCWRQQLGRCHIGGCRGAREIQCGIWGLPGNFDRTFGGCEWISHTSAFTWVGGLYLLAWVTGRGHHEGLCTSVPARVWFATLPSSRPLLRPCPCLLPVFITWIAPSPWALPSQAGCDIYPVGVGGSPPAAQRYDGGRQISSSRGGGICRRVLPSRTCTRGGVGGVSPSGGGGR